MYPRVTDRFKFELCFVGVSSSVPFSGAPKLFNPMQVQCSTVAAFYPPTGGRAFGVLFHAHPSTLTPPFLSITACLPNIR